MANTIEFNRLDSLERRIDPRALHQIACRFWDGLDQVERILARPIDLVADKVRVHVLSRKRLHQRLRFGD